MSFNGPMSDISDNSHSLLEPPSPAYTNVTVRRAFIVWMYCGQRNKFKDVCNYFHHLEAFEDQQPPERRALSRHHEFNLFSNQPPTSTYLIDHFPQLYKETYVEGHYISKVEEIRNEKCAFKLEGFNEFAPKQGTTTREIVEASRMIRKYCRLQMVSLKKFLEEFKQHANICNLKYTVNNVAFYIKRKMIQAEIELEANYPKTLDFLNSSSVENIFHGTENPVTKDDCVSNNWISVSSCKEEQVKYSVAIPKFIEKGAGDSDHMTKNWCSITTCNRYSSVDHVDNDHKLTHNADSTNTRSTDNTEPLMAGKVKSISIEDMSDESVPIKKERRFSGSQFMKIKLEKFRKI